LSVVALTTAAPPLPIFIAAYELLKSPAIQEKEDALIRMRGFQYIAAMAFLVAVCAGLSIRMGPELSSKDDTKMVEVDFPNQ
jgi:hypothetical protein